VTREALAGPYYQENGQCPYLPDRDWCSIFFFGEGMPEAMFSRLLETGFRRSGRAVYMPSCRGCRECVSIRIPVAEFRPTPDQKRAWKKNPDVQMTLAVPAYTEEKHDLYQRFIDARYPDREELVTRRSYESFFVDNFGFTREFQYRVNDRLVGVGIVDLVSRAASSVYFYFDPDESKRSLGTYSLMREIEYCKETGREFLYLGFRVKGCKAMAYKSNFRPHQLLEQHKGWVREEHFDEPQSMALIQGESPSSTPAAPIVPATQSAPDLTEAQPPESAL
jgi:leucyl-tRNA---protein transferase